MIKKDEKLTIRVKECEKIYKKNDKSNKTKKIKDPDAPKRNINAFFHFNNEKREQYLQKMLNNYGII